MRILAILMGSIVSSSISCTLLALILTVLYPMIRCIASKFRGLKIGRWGNTQPENHAETIRHERYFTGIPVSPSEVLSGKEIPLRISFSLAVAMLYFFSPFLSRSQRPPSPSSAQGHSNEYRRIRPPCLSSSQLQAAPAHSHFELGSPRAAN